MAKHTKGGLQRFADGNRVKKGKGMAALNVMGRLGADTDAMMNTRRAANTQFGDLGPSASSIIKDVGGNWVPTGQAYDTNLDTALNSLKRARHDTSSENIKQMIVDADKRGDQQEKARLQARLVEVVKREAANKWVDSNLKNYITKQMATEADPVRKLAEEGITAFPKIEDEYGDLSLKSGSYYSNENRKETGFPEKGVAKNKLARHYEVLADEAINPVQAERYQRTQNLPLHQRPSRLNDMPWVKKLDPESRIYSLSDNADFERMGFNHIMDVLREDLAAGRIRPEQLNKISMEQAVRRAHDYDEALKAKMLMARQKEMGEATLHKEYPEGYKWVELNRPGQFALESDTMGHSVRGYEPPKGHPDWIESSDNSGHLDYGHGGWEAIKEGRAKIYSLRDPKGMSHATVEVGPINDSQFQKIVDWKKYQELQDKDPNLASQWLSEQKTKAPNKISQIKGKQNTAPNEEYQQYIQDFVKGGDWSDVQDLHNTGLTRIENLPERKRFEDAGMKLPKYYTDVDRDALIDEYNRLTKPATDPDFMAKEYGFPKPEGMADGGSVPKFSDGNRVKKGKGMAALGLFDRLGADASTLMNARNNTKFGDMAPPTAGVVKEAGGNWLTGNIKSGIDPLVRKQVIGNVAYPYGPEYEAGAKARVEKLKEAASQPGYVGGAQRVIEAIEEGLVSPESARKAAINKWVEKNVTNYIKNEMGTEGDRVRKMLEDRWNAVETKYKKAEEKAEAMQVKRDAEPDVRKHPMMDRQIRQFKEKAKQEYEDERQHIGHIPRLNQDPYANRREYDAVREEREHLGYPPYGQANSPTAQNWENLSDSQIKTKMAWELNHGSTAEQNPFLNKLESHTPVHRLRSETGSTGSELGIDHVLDRLEQAVEAGTIKPEKLQSITMDQAMRMAADMDLADTRKARDARLEKAKNLKVEKEYPDEGMRWVDLDAPLTFDKDTLPAGFKWAETKNGMYRLEFDDGGWNRTVIGETPEEAIKAAHKKSESLTDAQRKKLREALEYESDIMGHCVGRSSNYCDKVMAGQGRILSLRNEANEPHVTMETARRPIETWDDVTSAFGKKEAAKLHNEFLNAPSDSLRVLLQTKGLPTHFEEILQVKGKSNKAPVEKYLPYVQDLIREKKFPIRDDLANTGLYDVNEGLANYTPQSFEASRNARQLAIGRAKQAGELEGYMTRPEWEAVIQKHLPEDIWLNKPPEEGMKEGGIVKHSHHYHQIARDFDLPHLSEGGEVVDGTVKDRAQMVQDMYAHIADMRKHFNKGGSTGPRRNEYFETPDPVNYQDPLGAPSAPVTENTMRPINSAKEYAGAFKDAATNAYYGDKRNMVTPKGKKNFSLQALAAYAGTPADLTTMAIEGVGGNPTMQLITGMANKMGSKIPALSKPVSVLDPKGERVMAYPLSSKMEPATEALQPYTSEGQIDKLGHDYKFYSAPLAAMAVDMGAGMAIPAAKTAKNGSRIFPVGNLRPLPKPAR